MHELADIMQKRWIQKKLVKEFLTNLTRFEHDFEAKMELKSQSQNNKWTSETVRAIQAGLKVAVMLDERTSEAYKSLKS